MKTKKHINILLIEDERPIRKKLASILEGFGSVTDLSHKEEALARLQDHDFDLAIIDLNLNGKLDGFKILEETKKKQIYSVILSSNDSDDYYQKAMNELQAEAFYNKADFIKSTDLIMKEYFLKQNLNNHSTFTDRFITQDPLLKDSIRSLVKYQAQGSSILILGESGVGKTELAKVLHKEGGFEGEFVFVNASAISENLLESTLFGHLKGSFTGALSNKKGLLAKANGGTLFIDEIATIPLSVQTKLLTCLDEKCFTPVGGENDPPIYSDFVLVTATCDDIVKKISEKKFRSDLFNRIAQETITIPPLRKRPDDIPLLVKHFMKKSPKKKIIQNEAIDLLKKQSWPDNTRGVLRIVKYCLSRKESIITEEIIKKKLLENIDAKSFDEKTELQADIGSITIDYDFIEKYGFKEYMEKAKSEIIQTIHHAHCRGKIKSTLNFLQLSKSNLFKHLSYSKKRKQK